MRCHTGFEVGQTLGFGDFGHGDLMGQALFGSMKAGLQVKNGLTVLNGDDAASREALAIADAVDVVQNGRSGVAWTQEIGMQRVHSAITVVDSAGGGHEGLTGHLSTENALAIFLG